MKVVFLYADKSREDSLADAFVAGLRRHSVDAEKCVLKPKASLPIEVDAVCLFGVKSRELWHRYRKAGIHTIYFDKGYTRTGEYWRVSIDAHHPTSMLMTQTCPSDRLWALRLDVKPWRASGDQVVFAGSSAKYHAFYRLSEPTRFANKVVRRIRDLTDGSRRVIYRPKASWQDAEPVENASFSQGHRTIYDDLRGAHALVTHGSNACFEAMLMGIPSVILGDAIARPISSTDLEEIEAPRLASDAERMQLLSSLAYFQWTLPEMASGLAWEFLRQRMPERRIDPLYTRVCRLLGAGHGQQTDGPEDTLNRLFRKTCGDLSPWLTDLNVSVSLERRKTADLVALASPRAAGEMPKSMKVPVTIVNYLGRDHLLDGSKRIHAWAESGREKIYTYVLTVR